ncbi:MAG TPA: amino acid adenylation domain-containing protein [Pedobacter sp.]|jgi:amino acid adenylation domain-containing protein
MNNSFIDLFEDQALKNPENIAVVFESEQITYKELDKHSNRLAKYLQSHGATNETLVPLFIERSINMIVGMLGIMKAGCAYVPIDTDFPQERISFMLTDTKASIAVSSKNKSSKLPPSNGLNVVEIEAIIKDQDDDFISDVKPDQLAYIIYTSGSTGNPKGVMIEHHSLVDYVNGLIDKIQIDQCRTFALVSSIATDLGNTVIYGSLASGGALHLFSKDAVSNTGYLHHYFEQHSIECLKIVPSHWKALNDDEKLLLPKKLIVFGGEALSEKIVEDIRLSGSACKIVNHYGPTETTIGKLLCIVEQGAKYESTVPIGKPFSDTKVLILNASLKLCPIGVPGQLYITGAGLARGYLNNEELTKLKFISNPFIKTGKALMYATGDLVKYLPDGNVQFLGRVDDQVKIRGYRVEPGEISGVIEQSELVKQAFVTSRDDHQGNKQLVAYLIPEEAFDKEEILSYLKHTLPDYMVPSHLVEMDSFPLAPNGKIDRKALPEPGDTETKDAYTAPRNETETRLAEIWQDILEVDQVGIHDDFFELGGHSLLAVRLISAVRKAFKAELPISDVFDYPTVATLAGQIETQSDEGQSATVLLPSIGSQVRPERIPLSFSQERLWFIDRLEGSLQYHVPAVLRLTGKLNIEALNNSFQQIVNRHEALRTVILEQDGKPYQLINPQNKWSLIFVNGSDFVSNTTLLQSHVNELIKRPFDLSKDEMMRGHLIELNDEYLLVVTLHHISSDGWSRSVLVRELVELYNAHEENRSANLPELAVQYADFAIWQRKYLQKEVLDKKLDYWKNQLEGVATLQLPTDYTRPAMASTNGAFSHFFIDKKLAENLQALSQQQGATLFMTLIASFKVLLHRYSGQEDICVGTPIAGRLQQETESLIGFFVNTLALRNKVTSSFTFTEVLQSVKVNTLEAYANQEVPFEKVVETVVKERELNRNPLFQVMFVLRNTPEIPELRLGNVKLTPESFGHNTAIFDIQFFITETVNGLEGVIEYNTDLYNGETIKKLGNHFTNVLRAVVETPTQSIGLLPMLSVDEREQILHGFNNTRVAYPQEVTLVDLIEKQVAQTSEAVAIVFEQTQLTYRELNERSNQLAHYLKGLGVQEDVLVPICLERSTEMIVAILGILKAGGAYVPIDPHYPAERISYMLKDTAASMVLCSKNSRLKLPENVDIIELDGVHAEIISKQALQNLNLAIRENSLAYVIYTSGSTGEPKGAMNEHKGIVNRLLWTQDYFKLGAADAVLQKTTFSFDVSVWELLWPLIAGSKLVFAKPDGHKDNQYLKFIIDSQNITLLHFVPSMLGVFLPDMQAGDCKSLRKVLCSGEALQPWQAMLFREKLPEAELYNLYGPTEAAIDVTCWKLPENSDPIGVVPIGGPVANTAIYILDGELNPVPAGCLGEIHLGGVQVGRGYLNRQDLTAEKFIPDPFSEDKGARMYKTGDIGRWLHDGNVEYIGRKDHQVKVRGYRIELGEIENALAELPMVDQSVMLAKEDTTGLKRLVGYIVLNSLMVKSKENELYHSRVEGWKELYNREYEQTEQDDSIDEEFNIISWNNSFTGNAIPEEEMREWLDDIVKVIFTEDPGQVFEIGCGTGLIYYQLAGKVKKYIGTDLSSSSVNQIVHRIDKKLRDYGPTELYTIPAHEVLTLGDTGKSDTVVLNSIIQYFPGESYLDEVLEKSITLLKGEGRIIIGDVRDKRLLELFKSRLNIQKMSGAVSIQEFKWAVAQDVLREEELCVSPDYFYNLKHRFPEIKHVEIMWKQGSYLNEMTLYRYSVVIHVRQQKALLEPQWQSWTGVDSLAGMLSSLIDDIPMIALKDVPNPRLWKERQLKIITGQLDATVSDLAQAQDTEDQETVKLNNLLSSARSMGYHYQFLVNEDPLKVNVLIERNPSHQVVSNPYTVNSTASLVSIPLFTDISTELQKEIKLSLHQRLPEYMVPSELVTLSQLPITSNGKLDRKFLNQLEERTASNNSTYEAPRNELEQKLADIWQELLHIERVGISDNFFDLGGHSLMAMKVVSQIKNKLSLTIPIQSIFQFPTIDKLGNYLEMMNDEDPASFDEIII